MRLKQFINEETNPDPEKLVALIKKNCKPYLRQKAKAPLQLYRGMKKLEYEDFLEITPRKDRKPRDTPLKIHKKIDDLFLKYHGIRARSEGVFVTTDYSISSYYGINGIVFPVGDFKFLWNPYVFDLSMDPTGMAVLKPWYKKLIDEIMALISKDPKNTDEVLENIIKGYKSTNLKAAMKSGNEIMIFCKKYYIVDSLYSDEIKQL